MAGELIILPRFKRDYRNARKHAEFDVETKDAEKALAHYATGVTIGRRALGGGIGPVATRQFACAC